MPLLDLAGRPEDVPAARAWAREQLLLLGAAALRDDVDLVLSELLANAVLHAQGAVRVCLVEAAQGVCLEVRDLSSSRPVRRTSGQAATTGRGLNLVAALADEWGVSPRDDGQPGKTVWCRLSGAPDQLVPDLDVDALLAAYDDEPDPVRRVEVRVGEAPVALLREAKDHLDGLLRELSLAEAAGGLPQEVVGPMTAAVHRFAEARGQLRALLQAAAARGAQRVELVFTLPVALADAGEHYLDALAAADAFARDRRMLSLESPVEHRVLREWYVGRLVSGLRAAAGQPGPLPEETFEDRLLRELHRLQQGQRAVERAARLQRVTARLAAAETVEEIARIAATEGLEALGASGAALTRRDGAVTVAVAEVGSDRGLGARYEEAPAHERPTGPSTQALRTGLPVFVESRAERDARFPALATLQPDVVAVAAVPLRVAGEVVGALRFSWSEPHVFSAQERELLQTLAAQTGQAVARVDALVSLEALRDELDRLLQSTGQVAGTDLGVLRTLYGEAPVGIAVFDAEARYLRVNDVLAAANDLPVADHTGRTVLEVLGPLVPAAGAEALHTLVEHVLATGAEVEREVTEGPGGRTWRTSWFPVRDAQEQVQAAVVLTVEITEQRQAEERTRLLAALGDRLARDRSEAGVLDALAEVLVPDVVDWLSVHLTDDKGRVWCALVRHRDPALQGDLEQLGASFLVSREQPHGAGRVLATGTSEQLPVIDEALLEEIAPGDRAFAEGLHRVGTRSGAVVPLVAGGEVLGALSVARGGDLRLTPRDLEVVEDVGRRAGAALQGVRALWTSVRLDIALDAADVGSYDWHVRTGHLDWDDRLFRLLDVDQETFDGTLETFFARLHPEDVARVGALMDRAVQEVGELEVVYRLLTRDGTVRWLEARGRALPGADGATEHLVGVAVDVTERQEGRAMAERTLELMGDAFFLLDDAWCFRYVNQEAELLLARSRAELLGREVWEAFPEAVGTVFQEQYVRAVTDQVPVRFEQYFPALGRLFEVRAHPGPDGLAVYFADADERRAAERERDRALQRLAQTDAIGSALTETLDVDEALTRLADLLVPSTADVCTIDLREGDDLHGDRAVVTVAADPAKAEAMLVAEAQLPRRHDPGSAVHQVLSGAPLVHLVVPEGHLDALAGDAQQAALYACVQMRHACVVPLVARGRVFGAISLIRTGDDAVPFTDDDLLFAQDVGRRAGLLVDNAAQYTAQRRVAEGLQRSLLPELPQVPGLALGAAYQPSSSAALVGGDWYDAFVLPDGATALVVGDVMGHDIAAAAAMGQLRSVLRTCAVDGEGPARVLDRLDRLLTSFQMAELATVVYGRLTRTPDGCVLLTWSNAGHPPPLVLSPGRPAVRLDGGEGVMLGTGLTEARDEASYLLSPGDTVLMFTDGMVERRGRDLDDQLEELGRAAGDLLEQVASPEELCERLLATVRAEGGTDDAAVVAVRVRPPA